MSAKVEGQLGMDETVLDDEVLEAALEERSSARAAASVLSKKFREKDEVARAEIIRAVPVGTIARVGRFRIERKATTPRHVEFDTKDGERISISADEEDA
jgi:hypothetical protein